MKEITIVVKRETTVKVTIDESVVDAKTLHGIQQSFDEDFLDATGCFPELDADNLSDEEAGYINYARCAAMHAIGIEHEFITLDRSHTKAHIEYDDFEFELEM